MKIKVQSWGMSTGLNVWKYYAGDDMDHEFTHNSSRTENEGEVYAEDAAAALNQIIALHGKIISVVKKNGYYVLEVE